jgi:hypothetical protein
MMLSYESQMSIFFDLERHLYGCLQPTISVFVLSLFEHYWYAQSILIWCIFDL